MILDRENLFSKDQAITATANSTDVIDTGSARNLGVGHPLGVAVQVTEDFATLTSLTVEFQTDSAENFSGATTLFSVVVPVADLEAGYKIPPIYVPRGTKRYVRLRYVVGGSNATAGKVTAGLVLDQTDWQAYPGVVGGYGN